MAGNPYTESGEKFRIPDMLANAADIYNLGEIIGDSADAFEMSYLENSHHLKSGSRAPRCTQPGRRAGRHQDGRARRPR